MDTIDPTRPAALPVLITLLRVGLPIGLASGCGAAATSAPTSAETIAAVPHARPALAAHRAPAHGSAPQIDCAPEPVYFDFDSTALGVQARDSLARTAECLLVRKHSTALVTGMTDPRGTEEYNLALGDRRAHTASRYIAALGVESERLQTRSSGEEYATGRDESGWALDRRVEPRMQ